MSVVITASARFDTGAGSIDNAAGAARTVLAAAGVSPETVAVVINCGVFRDSNLAEPAIAALIQKKADIGLAYAPGVPPTIGFDLMNGAAGPLNAVQVAQAMFASGLPGGDGRHILVVAGDSHPGRHLGADDPTFPHSSVGTAWLLSEAASGGFAKVYTRAETQVPQPSAYVDYVTIGDRGRSTLTVDRPDTTALTETVLATAREALSASTVPVAEITAVVSADVGDDDLAALGVASIHRSDAYSSGLLEAFPAARVAAGPAILLLAGSHGPSAAAALYYTAHGEPTPINPPTTDTP